MKRLLPILIFCGLAVGQVINYDTQVKNKPTFEVKHFKAKGNGIADDYAAITAAITAAKAAGGGIVDFGNGTYRTSGTVLVDGSNITIRGKGMGATSIVGDLAVTPVVKFSDGAIDVYRSGIKDIAVSRAVGTVPVGSIGVQWNLFNYGFQENLLINRHYIGESLHHPTSLSLGFHSVNLRIHDCSHTYLHLGSVTDSQFLGGELGLNGGETVGPVAYGIKISNYAEMIHMNNFTIIPRATGAGAVTHCIGITDYTNIANPIGEFTAMNCENVLIGVSTSATVPEFRDLKINGGRWANATSAFFNSFHANTKIYGFYIYNEANITGRIALTLDDGAAYFENSYFASDSDNIAGGTNGYFIFNGNKIIGTQIFTGNFKNLTVTGNSWLVGAGPDFTAATATKGIIAVGNNHDVVSGTPIPWRLPLGGSINQPAWTAVSFLNSWSDFDATTYDTAGYYKDVNGNVHLKGLIKPGTVTDGTAIFSAFVPGYQPNKTQIFTIGASNGTAKLTIEATGSTIISSVPAAATWLSLSGIVFRADK
jgi:hypothetical protein